MSVKRNVTVPVGSVSTGQSMGMNRLAAETSSYEEEPESAQRCLRQSNDQPPERDQRRAREQTLAASNAIKKDAPDR